MIRLESSRRTGDGFARSRYRGEQVDLFAGYLPELDRSYLIPFSRVQGMSGFQLRLGPARNGQRAGLNFAADYEFAGAVAQLGERRYGIPEVVGSSPISSTSPDPGHDSGSAGSKTVGAHEFRNRFGGYMERGAAGEVIHVSRRGRPYVRLLPAERTTRPTKPETTTTRPSAQGSA
jgi:prevent-host-death family protein